jgi:glycosyltransferase involved in cell wall biosynthesis
VAWPVRVERSGGRGPAAARNVGWRAGTAPWVVFLDDDVVPGPGWGTALRTDLAAAEAGVGAEIGDPPIGAVRGRIDVPLPPDRRPTDWERQTHGLATATGWLTADLAVRRSVLAQVDGFDERFPRAFREDADLQIRVTDAGWRGVDGVRLTTHPVPPARRWASLTRQRGNADDVLMTRRHGPDWRRRVGEQPGAFRTHAVTVAAAVAAAGLGAAGRPRLAGAAAGAWAASTARFAWRRIAHGPRTPSEVTTMVVTSVAIPPAAVWHRLGGLRRWRGVRPPA